MKKLKEYKSIYKESYRHSKMDDLVDEVFGEDYESAWEALWQSESTDDIKSAFDYIAQNWDFPEDVRNGKYRNQGDYAEALEEMFGDFKKLYTEYVLQMSDSEFKKTEKFIRRMYQ